MGRILQQTVDKLFAPFKLNDIASTLAIVLAIIAPAFIVSFLVYLFGMMPPLPSSRVKSVATKRKTKSRTTRSQFQHDKEAGRS